MITDDYVNFEIAKLLKEKEFDGECRDYYSEDGHFYCEDFKSDWNHGGPGTIILFTAPTLQMVMKWLREVHNKSIEIRSQGLKATSIGWIVEIYNLVNQDEEFHHPYTFQTYEEACEAAIKYCLENLI